MKMTYAGFSTSTSSCMATSVTSSSAVSSSTSSQLLCSQKDVTKTSVQQFVTDLRWYVEMECANVLHGKPILQRSNKPACKNSSCVSGSAASVKVSIEMLEFRCLNITGEFRRVFEHFQRSRLKCVHNSVATLTATLQILVTDLHVLLKTPSPDFLKKENQLRQSCQKLEDASAEFEMDYIHTMTLPAYEARFLVVNGHLPSLDPVTMHLSLCFDRFSEMIEQINLDLIQSLLTTITLRVSGANMYGALLDLLRLALKGDRFCHLITKIRGLQVLVKVCSDHSLKKYWPLALRTISSLCCTEEAVISLEKLSGLEMVTRILENVHNSEMVRAEAAGVVAQITSPYLSQNGDLLGSLSSHIESLIRALTMLSTESSTHDVFLLSAAAIANITFMSPSSFEYILKWKTVRVLIDACQLNKAESLFAKDQVATVLANMAAHCACQPQIIRENGIELLLHVLSESPSYYPDAVTKAACERVQQKAAIALSRLAREPINAQIIIEMEGLQRLVCLCRRTEERNNSDAVLAASLAALRQIHDSAGADDFLEIDLYELVKPKLIDAFYFCNSKVDESYV